MTDQTVLVLITYGQVQERMHYKVHSHNHSARCILIYIDWADLSACEFFTIDDKLGVVLLHKLFNLSILRSINTDPTQVICVNII